MFEQLRSAWRRRLLNSAFARLLVGDGPSPGPVELIQRRVFILPTRAGILFAVVLFIMLLAAINYSNSLGYMLTFVLTSVLILVIIHTYRNLYRLQINVGTVEPAFASTAVQIPLQINNEGVHPRLAVAASLAGGQQRVVDIPAKKDIVISLPHQTGRRGWHPLGRFTLETRFPMGLFRAWSYVELQRGHLVYPTPSTGQVAPPQSQYRAKQTGDRGYGVDDFVGLRSYHAGDPLRHIHWKAYARTQNLLVKQFGGDRSDEVMLDWRSLSGMDTEAKISRLTRWVLDAERENLDYGLWLPDVEIPPARGPEQQHRCLKALALHGKPKRGESHV